MIDCSTYQEGNDGVEAEKSVYNLKTRGERRATKDDQRRRLSRTI